MDNVRFWSKIDKHSNPHGCWIWTASKLKSGYGMFGVSSGRVILAHRQAWIMANGFIPDGLYVLHACDNPSCVNPSHLFLGSQADNMRDMIIKGRSYHPSVSGESNPNAKLSSEDVSSIEFSLKHKLATVAEIRHQYRIGKTTIYQIIRGDHWACRTE